MEINSLRDLYVIELRDLFDAESRIIKALPKMTEAATSPDLRRTFQEHLEQTRRQSERLEHIFSLLNEPPKAKKCRGLEGILDEGKEVMDLDAPPAVRDAALISAAQRVEHYEIAAYGTVRTFARRLGYEDQAQILQETLREEGDTNKKLTSLAESYINEDAKSAM